MYSDETDTIIVALLQTNHIVIIEKSPDQLEHCLAENTESP